MIFQRFITKKIRGHLPLSLSSDLEILRFPASVEDDTASGTDSGSVEIHSGGDFYNWQFVPLKKNLNLLANISPVLEKLSLLTVSSPISHQVQWNRYRLLFKLQ